ncbi:hypothetical protein CHGG_00685 [Chaetomium globosum CBS 148.51]|uniref:Kelch domain-containing protein n=1 Tax=Chaetomium globosum (strain ATCC 6205 / CBS 148.51 / DSM 1962 / NBRC 6347 / NRRL 1970) TaxID=306901 RepID=Q2HGG9_CHAGB|nr:uncharacterized protein CHGG_00685 [Chaetomium globosum CBS 148.51]EAQ92450.1 hypothetical protein CHGG_00685 [Chaetomium globosum CBS 148.51]
MESFNLLRRRTTELFNSMPAVPSMPSMPSMPSLGSRGSSGMKGTWEKLDIPPLPRSSHSADIVAGTVYIFGGEIEPRRPVDNDMHAITLPSSGAQADYYAIKAKPVKSSTPAAKLAVPTVNEPKPESASESESDEDEEDDEDDDDDEDSEEEDSDEDSDDDKELSEVPLTTPSPGPNASASANAKGKGKSISPPELPDVPAPRVGHATAVIGHRIFLFGGRGGPDMAPLDEGGRVWVFDTRTQLWSFLDPSPAAAGLPDIPRPAPRSYHAAVATSKPDTFAHPSRPNSQPHTKVEAWRDWALGTSAEAEHTHGTPQRPVVGVLAERATDPDADGYGTLIIHGGCLAEGSGPARAADVWAFDVRSRVWQRFPDAPGAGRGGAALALGGTAGGRLYRFGGFDGEAQAGGQLDFLELGVDTFDDQVSGGEEAVLCPRGRAGWKSLLFFGNEDVGYKEVDAATRPLHARRHGDADPADAAWPGNRSVASLEAVSVGGGREYLVLMFGEREASGAGHAAAGRFWDDVWAFQVPSEGMSLASVADTAFSVVGRRNGEGSWTRVETAPHDDEDDASAEGPGSRGWVASATMGALEENGIVVFGGLNEGNQRLGDGWIFRLG